MKSESNLPIEIWEAVRDFIPVQRRTDVAIQMLRSFEEHGWGDDDLEDIVGEDDHLTAAYHECFGEREDEDESEDY